MMLDSGLLFGLNITLALKSLMHFLVYEDIKLLKRPASFLHQICNYP